MPTIIDLDAEAAKLTMFRGQTPRTTRAERKGSTTQLARYRDGLLLLGKAAGTGHWETHPEDELVCVLDGGATLDIVLEKGPRSFALNAGMIAVVPAGAWHRFRSPDGRTTMSAVIPGAHIDLDVVDPRPSIPDFDASNAPPPSIIDLNAARAGLEAQAASVRLASYRDGILSLAKHVGKDSWELFLADGELFHILDGTAALEWRDENGYQSCRLRSGMIVVNPQGTWCRLSSGDGATLLAVTPAKNEFVDLERR